MTMHGLLWPKSDEARIVKFIVGCAIILVTCLCHLKTHGLCVWNPWLMSCPSPKHILSLTNKSLIKNELYLIFFCNYQVMSWLDFGCTQYNELGPCHKIHFLNEKNHTTKSARPIGVKGLGLIRAFWPITSEDFKPLTQQIGLASGCKAALIQWCFISTFWNVTYCQRQGRYIGNYFMTRKVAGHAIFRLSCTLIVEYLSSFSLSTKLQCWQSLHWVLEWLRLSPPLSTYTSTHHVIQQMGANRL
jgi:hypothetical protein